MRKLVVGVLLCSVCLGMLFGCKKSPASIDVESIVAYHHPVTEGWSNECFIDENGRVRGLDTLPISLSILYLRRLNPCFDRTIKIFLKWLRRTAGSGSSFFGKPRKTLA